MQAQTNEQVQKAIREKKAYLNTAWGRKRVTGYRHDTGWAATGDGFSTRSFMVCLTDIEIEN